eukprot:GHVR01129142.1.p1 GENE.GHVR01129142.1~~GHVR01129142.1.p1  ORF type:complete len:147 (+),score=19.49 GHVR01129142.1:463-903(+)
MLWGENAFICVQQLILVLLYWWFSLEVKFVQRCLYLSSLVCVACVVLSGGVPSHLHSVLALIPTPIVFASRVPQALQNKYQQHTGQLSLASNALTAAGNYVRIVTAFFGGSYLLMVSAIFSGSITTVLVLQILWYKGGTTEAKKSD